jgi:hypothetical protein
MVGFSRCCKRRYKSTSLKKIEVKNETKNKKHVNNINFKTTNKIYDDVNYKDK